MDADWDRTNLLALLQADTPNWGQIVQRIKDMAEEAFLTDPLTKMNAVHYVVLRRRTCPENKTVLSTVRAILDQNPEAAVACDAEHGFTPLAFLCDTAPLVYDSPDDDTEKCLQYDADLMALLHEENDLAMDIESKRGLSPLAVHVLAFSRLMRKRSVNKKTDEEQEEVDVSVSPVLEVLLEKSSLEDCSKALNTLYVCNTADLMKHYCEEEQRARDGDMSVGLENGWWLLDLMVQILFAAHNQLYLGQTITNFSPLHTLSAISDVPLIFLLLAVRADALALQKPEKVSKNLPIHNVASWEVPHGNPITRKSIALTTLLKLYPDADGIRNQDGDTPTDIYYRTTNTTS